MALTELGLAKAVHESMSHPWQWCSGSVQRTPKRGPVRRCVVGWLSYHAYGSAKTVPNKSGTPAYQVRWALDRQAALLYGLSEGIVGVNDGLGRKAALRCLEAVIANLERDARVQQVLAQTAPPEEPPEDDEPDGDDENEQEGEQPAEQVLVTA